jgi:hypothetical protein
LLERPRAALRCRIGKFEGDSALHRLLLLACVVLAACGPYPRDVAGALDRIEQSHRIRIGFTTLRREDEPAALDLVRRLEQATGARAELDTGPTEAQLARLEHGDLDLVIGEFAEDSPWIAPVAVIEPLSIRREGKRWLGLSPVARNGENRWIALIEREVRDSSGPRG